MVSTLASRLARLEQEADPVQQAAIQRASGGQSLSELGAGLLRSLDPDANAALAVEKFSVAPGQEPTDEQLARVEQDRMAAALRPFDARQLREAPEPAGRIDQEKPTRQISPPGGSAEAGLTR